jgi:hypothetical protein
MPRIDEELCRASRYVGGRFLSAEVEDKKIQADTLVLPMTTLRKAMLSKGILWLDWGVHDSRITAQ